MSLYIKESYVNATRAALYYEGDVVPTRFDDVGKLFRFLQQELGRCVGSVYIDASDGVQRIGWVFRRKSRYSDSAETYVQESWVEVHTAPPTRAVKYHLAKL